MKIEIRQICLLIILVLTFSNIISAQDEAAYQKALSEAHLQSNPSEYRGQALKKYLLGLENTRKSETELNQVVLAKLKELIEIDFYGAFNGAITTEVEFIKWREVLPLLPAEHSSAFKKLAQWKMDNYNASSQGKPAVPYPAGVPQPGFGWGKTVSSNIQREGATTNTNQSNTTAGAKTLSVDEYIKLGIQQYEQKDFDGAIRSFSECIRLNPNEGHCFKNRGIVYNQMKNVDSAIADLTQAIKLNPQDFVAYRQRGVIYYFSKKYNEAEADLKAALKINPNDENAKKALSLVTIDKLLPGIGDIAQASPHLKLGNEQLAKKDYDGAISSYSECIRVNPQSDSCYYNRGLAHNGKKNYDAAIADYTGAVKLNPKSANAFYNRALAYYYKGNYDAAIADYTQYNNLSPAHHETFYNRGLAYELKGNYELAIADYNESVRIKPDYSLAIERLAGLKNKQAQQSAQNTTNLSVDDYFKLGNQQLDQKDYDGAIRSFSECIRLNPSADGCYFNRGLANRNKQNYDGAIADFTQVIKLKPDNENAFINRGLAYNGKKNYEMVIADYEAALKINPNNEKVKAALDAVKNLVTTTKNFEETRKNYLAEEEKQNKISEDFLKTGNQQMGQKDYDAAVLSYTKCIEASPLNLECYRNRALSYGIKRNHDAAIQDYTAILLFKPLPEIYFSRALNYREKSDFDSAIKDFTKAIELKPDDSELYMERGGTYYYKKDYNPAITDLTRAIKMKPQEAKYYFVRGFVFKDSGNTASATTDFKKALELKPDFAAAKEQLQKLGGQP